MGDFQNAPWANEAAAQWFSGNLDRCHELILLHLTNSIQSNGLGATDPANGSTDVAGAATSSAPTSALTDLLQVNGTFSEDMVSRSQAMLGRWIEEQDYATLHNTLMVHYLSTGRLPWKCPDFATRRPSTSSSQSASHSVLQGTSNSLQKPPFTLTSEAIQRTTQPTSRLNITRYSATSVEASLVALGAHYPLAWYNLIVLYVSRGHYRTALRTLDEILDLVWQPLVSTSDALVVKFGFLFLYILIKLNYSSHPRYNGLVVDLEKVLSHRAAASRDNVTCLEQNVWFHILCAQLSLILLRMKSSKREVSAMMGAFAKWVAAKEALLPQDPSGKKQDATGEEKPREVNPSEHFIHASMQFVKSRLLDLRSNQDKAETDLKDPPSLMSATPAAFYNNLGVLAFHRHKFAVASLYFLKASQENQKSRQSALSQAVSDSRRHLPDAIGDYATEVTYNMGLQMLLLGQFDGALRCFQDVIDKPNPATACSPAMAHLRLAEAQLAVYCNKLAAQASSSPSRPHSPSPLGTPPPTSTSPAPVSPSSSSPAPQTAPTPASSSTGTVKPPSKTTSELFREGGQFKLQRIRSAELDTLLDGASNSLMTAALLFERYGRSGAPVPTAASRANAQPGPVVDRTQLTSRDILVKLYVNVLLAWACMESGNHVKAKEWCLAGVAAYNELDTPSSSPLVSWAQFTTQEKAQFDHYYFLAHLYHAEAELRLGGTDSALAILQDAPAHLAKYPLQPSTHPYGGGLQSTTAPKPSDAQKGTHAMGVVPPKTAVLCNMAAVYIVKKDLVQAQKLISQALTQHPNLLPAVALQIWLELAVGNIEMAARLMCDFRVQDLLCLR